MAAALPDAVVEYVDADSSSEASQEGHPAEADGEEAHSEEADNF